MATPEQREQRKIRRNNLRLAEIAERDAKKQRQFYADPVGFAFKATILANSRGRDRFGNPLFRK